MYIAYTDGSKRGRRNGIGYIITKDNNVIEYARKRAPVMDINCLETFAVIEVIKRSREFGIKDLIIKTDCKGIIDKLYKTKKMKNAKNDSKVFSELLRLLKDQPNTSIEWVSRKDNKVADKLSKESRSGFKNERVTYEELEIKRDNQSKDSFAPLPNKSDKKDCINKAHETKMVIRYRKNILLRCVICDENKAATDFPRRRKNRKRRACNVCQSKLAFFQN